MGQNILFLATLLLSQHHSAVRVSHQIQNQDVFTPLHKSAPVDQSQSPQSQWQDCLCHCNPHLITRKPAFRLTPPQGRALLPGSLSSAYAWPHT